MKAFQFRPEPVLRWRTARLDLAKASAARAATRVEQIRGEMRVMDRELRSGGWQTALSHSAGMEAWAAYANRCRRTLSALRAQLAHAEAALAAEMAKLTEAHRGVRALENLKRDAWARWSRDADREAEAFAGEVFLTTLQSRSRRARSSSG